MTANINDERGAGFRFSHIGLCVSDIKRAVTFYRDGLGFTEGIARPITNDHRDLIGVDDGVDLRGSTQYLRLDGLLLELIELESPESIPASAHAVRPMHHRGMTHLSLHVNDIDTAIETLTTHGGTYLEQTRLDIKWPESSAVVLFCLDPDGNRVELMHFTNEVDFG
ncbi:VOC family protein [Pseudarthrobacter sp. NPDC058196]|uniref:VOC family protein n=1 Tax=Pseudarthrobacter sp. NPDC058196 TaxID=3346376 RepID=UPI0036DDB3E5